MEENKNSGKYAGKNSPDRMNGFYPTGETAVCRGILCREVNRVPPGSGKAPMIA